jgi:hypothetical protein
MGVRDTSKEVYSMVRVPKWLVVVIALAFVVGLAMPALAADTKGKIKSVAADKNEFVMTDKDGKDWNFQLDKDAKVRLGTKESKLDELKPNDEVEVTYAKQGDLLIAKEIRCTRK